MFTYYTNNNAAKTRYRHNGHNTLLSYSHQPTAGMNDKKN